MKKFLNIAFYLIVFLILYNTFIPFNFVESQADIYKNINSIELVPFIHQGARASFTDILGNFLLFLPFGFLLLIKLHAGKLRNDLAVVTIAGFLLSAFIEIVQLTMIDRSTAIHDLILNTSGSWAGAWAAKIYLERFSEDVYSLIKKTLAREPLVLLIAAIILLSAVGAVLPFNVSITVSDLKKTVGKTNIVPFDFVPLTDILGIDYTHKNPQELVFIPADFLQDVLFNMVFGFLVLLTYRTYWRRERSGLFKLALITLAFFPLLEFIQFFIVSRVSDINDIVSGYLGVFIGAVIFYFADDRKLAHRLRKNDMRVFTIPMTLYVVFLLYKGLKPFDFTFDSAVIDLDLQKGNLVPFYAYFRKTSIWNIYDIVETIVAFMPIGLYIRMKNLGNKSESQAIFTSVLIAFALGVTIELFQVLSLTRVAEITDVILYSVGPCLGVLLYRWYEKEIRPEMEAESISAGPSQTEQSTQFQR